VAIIIKQLINSVMMEIKEVVMDVQAIVQFNLLLQFQMVWLLDVALLEELL
jgi:hypothetical protein